MLEDACLLNAHCPTQPVRRRRRPAGPRDKPGTRAPAIANVIIDQLRHGGSYVAAPQLVMQSGPLA